MRVSVSFASDIQMLHQITPDRVHPRIVPLILTTRGRRVLQGEQGPNRVKLVFVRNAARQLFGRCPVLRHRRKNCRARSPVKTSFTIKTKKGRRQGAVSVGTLPKTDGA